ncbi:MAG TPA: hypothetical protein VK447_20435 [Myxococcaceae bacterium]|nr:hypothetical protein [Myxococcaceae bacterium]
MQFDVSEEQAWELRRALDLHLHRLEVELVHTDDRSYRQELKKTMGALEGVRRNIEAPLQATPEASVSS